MELIYRDFDVIRVI